MQKTAVEQKKLRNVEKSSRAEEAEKYRRMEKLSKSRLQLLNKTTTKSNNLIKCYKEQIKATKYIEKYLMMRRIRTNQ